MYFHSRSIFPFLVDTLLGCYFILLFFFIIISLFFFFIFFFFNNTATTDIYTLSLHDALPIFKKQKSFLIFNTRFPTHGELSQLFVPTFLFLFINQKKIMKKIIFFAIVILTVACNTDDKAKVESMSPGVKDTTRVDLNFPYVPEYSSKFEIGDQNNALTILNLYKDWDNNTLDNSKNSFADSLSLFLADGSMLMGKRDSVIETVKKF